MSVLNRPVVVVCGSGRTRLRFVGCVAHHGLCLGRGSLFGCVCVCLLSFLFFRLMWVFCVCVSLAVTFRTPTQIFVAIESLVQRIQNKQAGGIERIARVKNGFEGEHVEGYKDIKVRRHRNGSEKNQTDKRAVCRSVWCFGRRNNIDSSARCGLSCCVVCVCVC